MADLFSRSYHCLWIPCRNLPSKHSERIRISAPFPVSKRRISFIHHTRLVANSSSSSTSVPDDVDILSSTECSDGSFVFQFAKASEIREKLAELEREKLALEGVKGVGKALVSDSIEKLNNEGGDSLGEENKSSSIVVVAVADQNPQVLITEKESVVLGNDSETPKINESQKIDRHLKLDSVEDGDGQHEILSEDDVVAECNGVPSVSEEESQVDGLKEVAVVPTTVTAVLDMISDINVAASGEVEEKVVGLKEVAVSAVTPELDMFGDAISAVGSELDTFGDLKSGASGEGEEKFDGHKEVAVSAVSPELDRVSDLNSCASREVEERFDGHKEVIVSAVTPELDMFGDVNSGRSGEVEEKFDSHEEVDVSAVTSELDMLADLNRDASAEVEKELDAYKEVSVSTVSPESHVFMDMNNGASGEVGEKLDVLEEVSVSTVTQKSDVISDLDNGASGEVEEKLDAHEEDSVSTDTPESDAFSDLNNGAPEEVEEKLDDHEEVFASTVTSESDTFSDLNNGAPEEFEEKLGDREEVFASAVTPEPDMLVDINNGASGEVDERLNSHEEAAVSTVTLESNMFADLNNGGASEEVEEKLGDHEEVVVSSGTPEADTLIDMNSDTSGEVDEKLDGHEEVSPEPDIISDLNNGASGKVEEKFDALEEVAISTVTESDLFSDLNMGASEEVEEKEGRRTADKGHGVDGATSYLTGGVDADVSELVPASTSLDSEQAVSKTTNNLTASLESELVANDEETTHDIVDDLIDASEMVSATVHDLVAPSDTESKIDVGNTERSDYENVSHLIVPELYSVETASYGERTSRTELFLVSAAACLPHPSKALAGREDAYFISHQSWLAVADGVGQWSLEGSNSELYIRELMEKCENIVSSCKNISTIKPAEVLTRSATETQTPGSSSVLVAYFDGEALHAANVGNTGFIIIRDGSIVKKSTAKFHEFCFPLEIVKGHDPSELIEVYKVDLCDGDLIIVATNGLFENLYDQEIASTISKSRQASLGPQEIAELLAKRAQEVGKSTSTRSPFADAAQAVGYVGYIGGKLDDVTVIVSLVQTR